MRISSYLPSSLQLITVFLCISFSPLIFSAKLLNLSWGQVWNEGQVRGHSSGQTYKLTLNSNSKTGQLDFGIATLPLHLYSLATTRHLPEVLMQRTFSQLDTLCDCPPILQQSIPLAFAAMALFNGPHQMLSHQTQVIHTGIVDGLPSLWVQLLNHSMGMGTTLMISQPEQSNNQIEVMISYPSTEGMSHQTITIDIEDDSAAVQRLEPANEGADNQGFKPLFMPGSHNTVLLQPLSN